MIFTCTATCRPDVLRRTLASFKENLRGASMENSELAINIDPAPKGENQGETAREANKWFDKIHVRMPSSPSFPCAVRWCWQWPTTEFFFHLEDDWLLTEQVNLDYLIDLMHSERDLSCVNLRAYTGIRDDRCCLSPGLWRTAHAQRIACVLRDGIDPEEQMRPWHEFNGRLGLRGFCWPGDPNMKVIKDIGRDWLKKRGLKKNHGKRLTTWSEA